MAGELQRVLRELGPCMSWTAAAELERAYNLSPTAARARVSQGRLSLPVRRLELPFPRRGSFLYLPEQFQSSAFWSSLSQALEETNGAYARTIWALRARGGLMPVAHFDAATATATAEGDDQLDGVTVRERLKTARLLDEVEIPSVGPCVGFASTIAQDDASSQMRARLIGESVLLESVRNWARNLGFGSYDSFLIRGQGDVPKVGRFDWDMTAPSYLGPLLTWRQNAPTPVNGHIVFDVLLGRVDEPAVRPYVYKFDTLGRMRNLPRRLQFVVAEVFTPEALRLLKARGIVAATTVSLFGKDVAEALSQLVQMLSHTTTAAADPERFAHFMSIVTKLEGAQGTLRGTLFEFIAAEIARKKLGAHAVVMNRIYRENGRDVAEVDVRADCGRDLYFIECKGMLPGNKVQDVEIDRWLRRRIPYVRGKTLENEEFRGKKLKFELWTTGELSEEAKAKILEQQAGLRTNTYTLNVRYGPELKLMAADCGDDAVLGAFNQHFFNHPMAEPTRPSRRQRLRDVAVEGFQDVRD